MHFSLLLNNGLFLLVFNRGNKSHLWENDVGTSRHFALGVLSEFPMKINIVELSRILDWSCYVHTSIWYQVVHLKISLFREKEAFSVPPDIIY